LLAIAAFGIAMVSSLWVNTPLRRHAAPYQHEQLQFGSFLTCSKLFCKVAVSRND